MNDEKAKKGEEHLASFISPSLGRIMTECIEKQQVLGQSRSRAINASQL